MSKSLNKKESVNKSNNNSKDKQPLQDVTDVKIENEGSRSKAWTKQELQERVRNKTALLVESQWTSSAYWKPYYSVQIDKDKKDDVCKIFAICKKCSQWLSVLLGTITTLSRHADSHDEVRNSAKSVNTDQKQHKITGFVQTDSVSPAIRRTVMRATLYMIAHDAQPFSVVEDKGFMKLAQTLIDTGAKHGKIDADVLFYDRTSLSKTHLPNLFNEKVEELKQKLTLAHYAGITTDHWTDDMVKNSYQAFSIHYLTEEFQLNSTCLGVYEFTESKTATAIKAKTIEILRSVLPPTLIPNVAFVTDNAANIKAAYKSDTRISCAGHNLNLVVTNALKSGATAPVNEIISVAKSVVGYFKHSGHNKDLDHTLKQDVSVRWNSQFFMLQSLHNEMDNVIAILEKEKQYDKLELLQNLDKQLLKSIIDFLHPFHTATVQLSLEIEPTFHRVWPTLHRLMSVCTPTLNDSEIMREIKTAFSTILQEKYTIHPMHKIATVLCPAFKSLTFQTAEQKNATYTEVRQQIDMQTSEVSGNGTQLHSLGQSSLYSAGEGSRDCTAIANLPEKKIKLSSQPDVDFLAEYMIMGGGTERSNSIHELDTYLEMLPLDNNDVLNFWRSHKHQLPKMAILARKVLSIPATSTPSERIFSACGHTLNDRRARMNAETLEKLMFLKYNM